MNKSGRYVMEGDRLVKVSDRIPKVAAMIDGVYFREPYMESFNSRERVWITSKGHKKAEMQKRGIIEYPNQGDHKHETMNKTKYFV